MNKEMDMLSWKTRFYARSSGKQQKARKGTLFYCVSEKTPSAYIPRHTHRPMHTCENHSHPYLLVFTKFMQNVYYEKNYVCIMFKMFCNSSLISQLSLPGAFWSTLGCVYRSVHPSSGHCLKGLNIEGRLASYNVPRFLSSTAHTQRMLLTNHCSRNKRSLHPQSLE